MKKILTGVVLALLMLFSGTYSLASDGASEEYITITVNATDDNGNLQYAIDEPVNFSSANTFTIPAGSSHTIYVKDAAGNITSQEYSASGKSSTVVSSNSSAGTTTSGSGTYEVTTGSGDQEINIDLELGLNADEIGTGITNTSGAASTFKGDYENYEYLTDTVIETPSTTVQNKTTTDGSDTAKKVFYTITTAEGDPFYLVIDQGNSNTVHLLNTVTRDDLKALAEADGGSSSSETTKEDNLLTALNTQKEATNEPVSGEEEKGSSDMIIIVIIVALGVGGYYYFKIYKKKKEEAMDAMDAMDMEEFQPEDDEDDDEIEFDDEEKQQMLDELIAMEEWDNGEEDEELLQQNPDDFSQEQEPVWEKPQMQEESVTNEEIAKALSAAEAFDEDLDGEEE